MFNTVIQIVIDAFGRITDIEVIKQPPVGCTCLAFILSVLMIIPILAIGVPIIVILVLYESGVAIGYGISKFIEDPTLWGRLLEVVPAPARITIAITIAALIGSYCVANIIWLLGIIRGVVTMARDKNYTKGIIIICVMTLISLCLGVIGIKISELFGNISNGLIGR